MNQSLLIALTFASLAVLINADFYDSEASELNMQKRKSAFMRFGRSAPDFDDSELNMAKRKSSYMRFGKRSVPALNEEIPEFYEQDEVPSMEKRKSSYMRFGKRKSAFMRFGKRSAEPLVEFVPVEEPSYYMEKRKPASIRFG